MTDLVHISIGTALGTAVLGYLVVFFGLVLLMLVLILMGKLMHRDTAVTVRNEESVPEEVHLPTAPGSAGELKLYDTEPQDAAMIMAIIADSVGKPVNELRFISIREVKDDEI